MADTKQPPPSQDHIIVREFREGVLVTTDGTLVYVLEVQPTDLSMLEPAQATYLKEQFGQFVSSVRFPDAIQLVTGSYPQNMSAYLGRLRERAGEEMIAEANAEDPVEAERHRRMAERLESKRLFIERALDDVRPLENRYFVVVFHNPLLVRGGDRMTPEVFARGKQKLDQLLANVIAGLNHASITCWQIDEREIANVLYWFYHQVDSPLADRRAPRLRLIPSLVTSGGRGQAI